MKAGIQVGKSNGARSFEMYVVNVQQHTLQDIHFGLPAAL